MSLPRLIFVVACLLTGVALTVDTYIESRRPLVQDAQVAEKCLRVQPELAQPEAPDACTT